MTAVVVREASRFGPCHLLGTLVGESRTRYVYRRRSGGTTAFVDRRSLAIHLEPCEACPDASP